MKVSVAIITYNQEKFIAKAMESAISQKTDFDYEIVIGEDCSTDKTRDIVIRYKRKYQDKIKLLLNEKNIGPNGNFLKTLESCQGKYIAVLEGDDYWTSEKKLQAQADLLDADPDYKFCFHLVRKRNKDEEKNLGILPPEDKRRDLDFKDLITGNFIAICSVMFLNKEIKNWPHWAKEIKMLDWPLYLLLLANGGKAVFLNEVMSVYRLHEDGVWSGNSQGANCLKTIEALNIFNRHFNYRHQKAIRRSIYEYYTSALVEFYNEKKYSLFLACSLNAVGIKLRYFIFTKLSNKWFNELLAIISSRSNFIVKKIITCIYLIQNFTSLTKKGGIKASLAKVFNYIFSQGRNQND